MVVLLRISRLAFHHKWRISLAYASMLGATTAYLYLPQLYGRAIDQIASIVGTGDYPKEAVFTTALLIIAASAVRGTLSYSQVYFGEALGLTVVYHLRNSFFNHVQRLSFGFHDSQHTGNLMSRAITDIEAVRMFVNAGLINTPYYLVLFFFVSILIMVTDWRLGVIGISFLPIVAILASLVRLKLGRLWRAIQEKMADLSMVLQENLTGVKVVKAFAAEEYEEDKFSKQSRAVSTDMVKAIRLQIANTSTMTFSMLFAMALIIWIGGARVIEGHISPGQLAQILFYLQILSIPIRHAGQLVNNFARAMSAGDRLFEVIDKKSPVIELPSARELKKIQGAVVFKKVSFSYQPKSPVLQDIEIDVKPGETIAIVGPPGSGKSTLVNLLPRFYEVDSGTILVDGMDTRDATLASLRANIGFVHQDVFVFNTSIRENIAYGRPSASEFEVVSAAKLAQLNDHIESLENGYDTQIGERGVALSGGQRQRLSIARAILLDPPILVMDDSTSSVDAQTEELIRSALDAAMRNRTTFIIAHRLTTVHRADQIIVLKEGQIVERGKHSELLALQGTYSEVYDLQFKPHDDIMRDFQIPGPGPQRELQ